MFTVVVLCVCGRVIMINDDKRAFYVIIPKDSQLTHSTDNKDENAFYVSLDDGHSFPILEPSSANEMSCPLKKPIRVNLLYNHYRGGGGGGEGDFIQMVENVLRQGQSSGVLWSNSQSDVQKLILFEPEKLLDGFGTMMMKGGVKFLENQYNNDDQEDSYPIAYLAVKDFALQNNIDGDWTRFYHLPHHVQQVFVRGYIDNTMNGSVKKRRQLNPLDSNWEKVLVLSALVLSVLKSTNSLLLAREVANGGDEKSLDFKLLPKGRVDEKGNLNLSLILDDLESGKKDKRIIALIVHLFKMFNGDKKPIDEKTVQQVANQVGLRLDSIEALYNIINSIQLLRHCDCGGGGGNSTNEKIDFNRFMMESGATTENKVEDKFQMPPKSTHNLPFSPILSSINIPFT